MAKLIHILAASVGGGLVLGASIRLGEVLGSSPRKAERKRAQSSIDPFLAARLDRLEEKIQASASASPVSASPGSNVALLAGVIARMDRQQSEMEKLRRQLSDVDATDHPSTNAAERLRDDLNRQLSEDLDQRLAVVEEKLHLSMNAANREAANAMLASIENRVTPRIARLEAEISSQCDALAELRDCSLQSQRSILRLVTVLERTMQNPGSGDKLSVMTGPVQDESGGSAIRRPA